MKKPNFFIIGAPKCGTTSLSSWLSEHPAIFMSKKKEPQYFNTDYAAPGRPRSLKEYEMLFAQANSQHKAVGEASTSYLRSREAVPKILNYCPSARFIVCLRNTVDMVPSVHAQLVKQGIETVVEFDRAWALQWGRQRGECIPRTSYDKKTLLYGENCLLGQQMYRLFEIVLRQQVMVVFLEDLKSNPGNEYRRILNFLIVPDDGRKHFPVKNMRKLPRFPMISQALRLVGLAKMRLGWHGRTGVIRIIGRLNNRKPKSQKLSPEMEVVLREFFKEDIELLARVVDRDLSHWNAIKK